MSKKIVVAGAGHGGVIAAAKLAKEGFDVTVYEKKKRENIGHDWEDRFDFRTVLDAVEKDEMPDGAWKYRGNTVFVSPSKRTEVKIDFAPDKRQKVMWRKPLINIIIDYAESSGVKFAFENEIISPIIKGNAVVGICTANGEVSADFVIDAAGVFSPVRKNLPDSFSIEKMPKRGDVFYGYRAYFDKAKDVNPEYPFEVYLYHEREQGLSWFMTGDDYVDVLIGRIDPLTDEKINEQTRLFRKNHDWLGENIVSGGVRGVIPVRRSLSKMVANGYAAVGDSAFMTTPMNGIGIELSVKAGLLLAKNVINSNGDFSANALWEYNKEYLKLYGGDVARNEGLKNSLLKMPSDGVDFLFDNAVIQSSDLAGAGRNMNFKALLMKFVRGMKQPKYFFQIIHGLIKGGKTVRLMKHAPKKYDERTINRWQNKIEKQRVEIR